MPLFQQAVVKKYLNDLDKELLQQRWAAFTAHFHNATIQQNILNAKEEEYQEGFVRDLFVKVLGYTLNPQPDYNFVLEKKTEADSTKSDGAIITPPLEGQGGGLVKAVIELKDTATTDLDKVEKQAFGYKHRHPDCTYIITANFQKLRFYINDAIEYEEFDLFTLTQDRFALLYLCLSEQTIFKNIPLLIKKASLTQEEAVTKKLYSDYSGFRKKLFHNIAELNPQHAKIELFQKTQKLLDRFLFILFAEDRLLVPANSVRKILDDWKKLKEMDAAQPLYHRFKLYFSFLNTGREQQGAKEEIFAYNGGLFAPDEVLDNLKIDDDILYESSVALSNYDFQTEIDVNILGHIFEHSLTEIEELQAEAEGKTIDKTKTKRKKDGVFYTPRYITKYIVENTIGSLCKQKKEELQLNEEDYAPLLKKKNQKQLLDKLTAYRHWLLQLTICDPACGSGAFLNQALEFLIAEHRHIDELDAKLGGHTIIYSDVEKSILENNLYGVDINEEAVEIARLSLWLRTAQKGRKLSHLNENIKCGNSLIDDPAVAGDKAFNWQKEFPGVFGSFAEEETVEEKKDGYKYKEEKETAMPEETITAGDDEESNKLPTEQITNQDLRITNQDLRIVNEPAVKYKVKKKIKGGFDVVIGNPPYVDIKALPKEITEFIFKQFESANNRINLFAVFIEKSLEILKKKGAFSFIIPSSLLTQESYKGLRKILLQKTELNNIIRLPNESFGGSAGEVKVDTIILTFQLSKAEDSKVEILVYHGFERISEISSFNANQHLFINQSDWEKDESSIFRINVNDNVSKIISKIADKTEKLIDCADFSLGLTPYDKYRGHTEEQITNRAFHSSNKKDDTYKKLLAGNDVRRYAVQWGGEEWISYGEWLGAAREQRFFTEKRILIKQIIDWTAKRIWAAITGDELYNTQNAFNIIAKPDYSPEYLLTLINSKLLSFYLRKKFLEEYKDRFQKILIKDCKEFPIKKISQEQQFPFIAKADIMLAKNKELQELKQQLLQLLQSNFPEMQLSKKLEQWPSLGFAELLKELGKQKIKPTLPQQSEWMNYFEEQKAKALALQTIIDTTDTEIDAMVYALYGLTEEEIKIVEGAG